MSQRLPRRQRPSRNQAVRRVPRNIADRDILPMPRMRPEMKFAEGEVHQADVIDTGYSQLLNGIGVGAEVYQRVGRQIQLVNLDLRFAVTQQNGALNTQLCRVMVVYDKQTNGLNYPSTALLDNSVPAVFWPLKQYQRDNLDRFIVLMDEVIQVNPNLLDNSFPYIHRMVNLRHLFTQFNAVAGALVNTIQTGSLYLWTFSMAPLGLINLKADMTARVNYLDA